ncbi:MAG: HD domain-containing protein [Chitinivorax sp.]
MDSHQHLHLLEQEVPVSVKLAAIHATLRERYPVIHRIAVASYDPATDIVKTYVYSNDSGHPLAQYERRLAEVPSLLQVMQTRQPRILTHIRHRADGTPSQHRQYLADQGYQASFTIPLIADDQCFGFAFFDSREADPFTPLLLQDLATFSHLIMLMVLDSQHKLRTLRGAMRTAHEVIHLRDFETGNHLERMARYARLIAQDYARELHLSDEFVEHVFLFAPLHDIGKIAVPDSVLLKPGPLSDEERVLMRRHVEQGVELTRQMVEHLGLGHLPFINLLYDIVGAHHEAWDGSGYPAGLAGEQIPLAGRIVTAADVFDALTSRRPYKDGWSIDAALDWMECQAGRMFDPVCVSALLRWRKELPAIQRRFGDCPSA